jgi:hypothetical protein
MTSRFKSLTFCFRSEQRLQAGQVGQVHPQALGTKGKVPQEHRRPRYSQVRRLSFLQFKS